MTSWLNAEQILKYLKELATEAGEADVIEELGELEIKMEYISSATSQTGKPHWIIIVQKCSTKED
jgi:hypothetical protein